MPPRGCCQESWIWQCWYKGKDDGREEGSGRPRPQCLRRPSPIGQHSFLSSYWLVASVHKPKTKVYEVLFVTTLPLIEPWWQLVGILPVSLCKQSRSADKLDVLQCELFWKPIIFLLKNCCDSVSRRHRIGLRCFFQRWDNRTAGRSKNGFVPILWSSSVTPRS